MILTWVELSRVFSRNWLNPAEWARLLKPNGRLLFTDPTVVTGPLTNAEIAVRSSAGFYLFVPQDLAKLIDEDRVRAGGECLYLFKWHPACLNLVLN
jgi:hypothetical protein